MFSVFATFSDFQGVLLATTSCVHLCTSPVMVPSGMTQADFRPRLALLILLGSQEHNMRRLEVYHQAALYRSFAGTRGHVKKRHRQS